MYWLFLIASMLVIVIEKSEAECCHRCFYHPLRWMHRYRRRICMLNTCDMMNSNYTTMNPCYNSAQTVMQHLYIVLNNLQSYLSAIALHIFQWLNSHFRFLIRNFATSMVHVISLDAIVRWSMDQKQHVPNEQIVTKLQIL